MTKSTQKQMTNALADLLHKTTKLDLIVKDEATIFGSLNDKDITIKVKYDESKGKLNDVLFDVQFDDDLIQDLCFDDLIMKIDSIKHNDGHFKCCICGKIEKGYGNNAQPIKEGVCCDLCNSTVVIPARLKLMEGE